MRYLAGYLFTEEKMSYAEAMSRRVFINKHGRKAVTMKTGRTVQMLRTPVDARTPNVCMKAYGKAPATLPHCEGCRCYIETVDVLENRSYDGTLPALSKADWIAIDIAVLRVYDGERKICAVMADDGTVEVVYAV